MLLKLTSGPRTFREEVGNIELNCVHISLQDFSEPFCGVHYVMCTVTSHREARAYNVSHSQLSEDSVPTSNERAEPPTGRNREVQGVGDRGRMI